MFLKNLQERTCAIVSFLSSCRSRLATLLKKRQGLKKKTQTLLVLQQQNSIFLSIIHFYFFEVTFVYEGCNVNDALLTRYCDTSVETAKCLYKESQPKNKNKLNFLWVNRSGSWDLSLNQFSTKKRPSITRLSSIDTEKKINIFLKFCSFN